MKHIVLPTDFSDNAFNAINYALQLFKEDSCTFYLLNAYSPPIIQPTDVMNSSTNTKELLDIVTQASENGLKDTLKKIAKKHKNSKHQFELVSKFDFLLGTIKSIVEEKHIDFIVMGTKGAGGIKEVIIGSNTAGVIGHVNCPILAIPEEAVFQPIHEIAFATDYDYYFEKDEIKPLTDIAKKFKATIKIMHALELNHPLTKDQEEIKRYVDATLKGTPHDFYTLTNASLETATRLFIQSRDIGMLCMIAKHHNFFSRLFGKPRVEEISFHIKIPYLILHEYKN